MKKILLGLLALSAVTFAANPGTDSSADITIQAKLEVLAATNDLVIEELNDAGNWQPVAKTVEFDHGQVLQSTTSPVDVPTPSLVKSFRVKRANAANLDANSSAAPGSYSKFSLDIGGVKGTVAGNMVGTGAPIPHTFRTTDTTTPSTFAVGTKEIQFNIESIVPKIGTNQAAGVYTRTETVTVTLNN
ncbi:hypothetical protein HMPREF0202_01836 [Cetobacterium somerae ATCC BAA-474]|uniref:WxL domain-containing protein n=1 Tax=Cetobacterium somerae ATCC BAA-474 TaxID=1319815 RepID=U7V9V3_9FUSO|nr:hypothetical protein [Cetobacterium somerae]ERT68266.1 hypothetical protein HMPREF0202_01836 [Cetobacterium somerae ATCC BAA-474]